MLWALTDLLATGDPLFSLRHTVVAGQRPAAHQARLARRRRFALHSLTRHAEVAGAARRAARARPRAGASLAAARRPARPHRLGPGHLRRRSPPPACRSSTATWRSPRSACSSSPASRSRASPSCPPATRRAGRGSPPRCVVALGGAAFTATHLHPGYIDRELTTRRELRQELARLVTTPAFTLANRCGPVTVPNHKLIPDTRWVLHADADEVLARSDLPASARRTQRRAGLRDRPDDAHELDLRAVRPRLARRCTDPGARPRTPPHRPHPISSPMPAAETARGAAARRAVARAPRRRCRGPRSRCSRWPSRRSSASSSTRPIPTTTATTRCSGAGRCCTATCRASTTTARRPSTRWPSPSARRCRCWAATATASWSFCTEASFVVLCAGIYRLARLAFTPLVGLAAAGDPVHALRLPVPGRARLHRHPVPGVRRLGGGVRAGAPAARRDRLGAAGLRRAAAPGGVADHRPVLPVDVRGELGPRGADRPRARCAAGPATPPGRPIGPVVWVLDRLRRHRPPVLLAAAHQRPGRGARAHQGPLRGPGRRRTQFFLNLAKAPVLYAGIARLPRRALAGAAARASCRPRCG